MCTPERRSERVRSQTSSSEAEGPLQGPSRASLATLHRQAPSQDHSRAPTVSRLYSIALRPIKMSTTAEVKFIKLNSYVDAKVLIKPTSLALVPLSGNMLRVKDVASYLGNDNYRVFLRFCKYSPTGGDEQQDCLPKSFIFTINNTEYQIKSKIIFAPYDITHFIACELNSKRQSKTVKLRISIDPNSAEANEPFHFGLFLVEKADHGKLWFEFKQKKALDRKYSIEMANKKLNPNEDSSEIAIVETANQLKLKISLLCPLTATRIQYPARSRHCDHVHCFDGQSFISLNELTPRWKCPICKDYIKLDDLVLDGLFDEILKKAPPSSSEFELFADGTYVYIVDPKDTPVADASNGQSLIASTSNCQKRKFEEVSKESVASNNHESPKTGKVPKTDEIECVTLDSSSEDESSDSDDEIEIVFEATSSDTGTVSKSSSAPGKPFTRASTQSQPDPGAVIPASDAQL